MAKFRLGVLDVFRTVMISQSRRMNPPTSTGIPACARSVNSRAQSSDISILSISASCSGDACEASGPAQWLHL